MRKIKIPILIVFDPLKITIDFILSNREIASKIIGILDANLRYHLLLNLVNIQSKKNYKKK